MRYLRLLSFFASPLSLLGFAQIQHPEAMMLIEKARPLITMESPETPSFHLEASFETFDLAGVSTGKGTVSETLMHNGPTRRSITYRSNHIEMLHTDRWRAIADTAWKASYVEEELINAVLSPLPTAEAFRQRDVKLQVVKAGAQPLSCAVMAYKGANPFQAYCFDSVLGLLRAVEGQNGYRLVLNSFHQIGSKYLPYDVAILVGNVKRGTLHVEQFASAPGQKEVNFTLPEVNNNQTTVSLPVDMVDGTSAPKILKKVTPEYPIYAKSNHISGSVLLSGVVGKDGSVHDLEVISAPHESLAESALTTVHQWHYTPTLVNGEPVEVKIICTVNYSFGN